MGVDDGSASGEHFEMEQDTHEKKQAGGDQATAIAGKARAAALRGGAGAPMGVPDLPANKRRKSAFDLFRTEMKGGKDIPGASLNKTL